MTHHTLATLPYHHNNILEKQLPKTIVNIPPTPTNTETNLASSGPRVIRQKRENLILESNQTINDQPKTP